MSIFGRIFVWLFLERNGKRKKIDLSIIKLN